jgi:pSer/pThr/pTyr-binding forkhead associated (FHA) protein
MSKPQPKLTVVQGPFDKKTVLLRGKKITIGRSSDNDLPVPHQTVSRHHAKIARDQGEFYLTDLGSHNGTWVNNKRLDPQSPFHLAHGDLLQIGGSAVVFEFHDPDSVRTADEELATAGLKPVTTTVPPTTELLNEPTIVTRPALETIQAKEDKASEKEKKDSGKR